MGFITIFNHHLVGVFPTTEQANLKIWSSNEPCNHVTRLQLGPILPHELQHIEQQERCSPEFAWCYGGEINGLFHPYRKDPIFFKWVITNQAIRTMDTNTCPGSNIFRKIIALLGTFT